eukprot:scaffold133_cov115-Cylindrotheca_fusiformis.AAC.8
MRLILAHALWCAFAGFSADAFTPLEAKTMTAKVLISSGVEFASSGNSAKHYKTSPDVSSVLATLTSFPRESFHQKVQDIDVTGNPQPEAVTRDEFKNLQLYWTKPSSNLCSFQLQATVQTTSEILPVKQKIRFPILEEILPPEIANEYLQITEVANQNPAIQELAHAISQKASDKADLYHVVFAIADWVQTNIKYDQTAMLGPQKNILCRSAAEVLASGMGKCDELSALFVSLNRALGIPARFATGYAYTNMPMEDDNSDPKNWGGHAWAEVYFPGVGWVPFDVAYGEYGYLSAGHIILSTSDDAADNSNVHYHAQGFDFTISPKVIEISVEPTDLTSTQWSDWKPSSSQSVQLSLESTSEERQVGIGKVVELLCTMTNPNDHYICTRLDVAKTQDTKLLDDISKRVLLNPKETKEFPLSFEIDPYLKKGYAYEFPFSVSSGVKEARTTVMVKDQSDSRQKQVHGMSMQWESPAGAAGGPYPNDPRFNDPRYNDPRYNDPRGNPPPGRQRPGSPPPQSFGRPNGFDAANPRPSTGNREGDWWGDSMNKSMFQENQPRQPSPEEWQRAVGPNYGRNAQSYYPNQNQPPQDSYYGSSNNQVRAPSSPNQDQYTPKSANPTRSANPSAPEGEWYDKAGKRLVDENNAWWNKEKTQGGTVRDYETTFKTAEDTSWSMGGQGRVDDTRGRNTYGSAQAKPGDSTKQPGRYDDPNRYSTNQGGQYDGRSSSYTGGDPRQQRFNNQNRYDDSFYSKPSSQYPPYSGQQGQQYNPGYENQYDPRGGYYNSPQQPPQPQQTQPLGGWSGGRATRNDAEAWQRNDLTGRSRQKYYQEQMPLQPPPPQPFGPYDPYGPPPPLDGSYDYRDERQQQGRQNYSDRRNSFGNADGQAWWDKT